MNVLVLNIMKQVLRGANGVQQAERIALSVNPAVAGRGWSVCLPVSRSLCHIFLKSKERFTSFRASTRCLYKELFCLFASVFVYSFKYVEEEGWAEEEGGGRVERE